MPPYFGLPPYNSLVRKEKQEIIKPGLAYSRPVIGFRVWAIEKDGTLSAPAARTRWRPGSNIAYCRSNKHDAPSKNCDCGFNAFGDFPEFAEKETKQNYLWGAVVLKGRAQIHESGIRAEEAEIVTLLHNPNNDPSLEGLVVKKYSVSLFDSVAELKKALPDFEDFGFSPPSVETTIHAIGSSVHTEKTVFKEASDSTGFKKLSLLMAALLTFILFGIITAVVLLAFSGFSSESTDLTENTFLMFLYGVSMVVGSIIIFSGINISIMFFWLRSKGERLTQEKAELIMIGNIPLLIFLVSLFAFTADQNVKYDRNTQAELVTIAAAQESYFSTHGKYTEDLSDLGWKENKIQNEDGDIYFYPDSVDINLTKNGYILSQKNEKNDFGFEVSNHELATRCTFGTGCENKRWNPSEIPNRIAESMKNSNANLWEQGKKCSIDPEAPLNAISGSKKFGFRCSV